MRRHLDPMTKEPRGPLWLGLLLILGGLFGLLLLFTGCGSTVVSAGPSVAGSHGLGYDGVSYGVQAAVDRPGLRVSGHVSTARKAGSDQAGGSEIASAHLDVSAVVADRYRCEADGLDVVISAGQALGGGTLRYHFGSTRLTLDPSTTSYLWQLTSGLVRPGAARDLLRGA